MNISRVQLVRYALRAAPLAFGAAAVVLVQYGVLSPQIRNLKLDSQTSSVQPQASSNPTDAPDILVNGQKVDVGPGGAVDETLGGPGGSQTHVSAAGGQTTVDMQDNSGGAGPENNKPNNSNVSVSTGPDSGSGLNMTQINSSSSNQNSNGFSNGFSTSQVFSTSSSNSEQNTTQ